MVLTSLSLSLSLFSFSFLMFSIPYISQLLGSGGDLGIVLDKTTLYSNIGLNLMTKQKVALLSSITFTSLFIIPPLTSH